MSGKRAVDVLKGAVAGYSGDKVAFLSAALAFSATFAMAPLLIIVIEIGAALLGGNGHHAQVRDVILNRLQPAVGKQDAAAIAGIVEATFDQQRAGIWGKIVTWVVFIIAATGFFGAVQAALDEIWRSTEKPGFMQALLLRAKSFAIIAAAAVLIVAMGVLSTTVAAIGGKEFSVAASIVLMLVVTTGIFAVLYKWLPRTTIGWRDVLGGSAVTAVLSVAGQYAIGLYLGRASTTSVYGGAGSLAAILIWLYYSATIFLVGAELIKAYSAPRS